MNWNWLRPFSYTSAADRYTSPTGGKNREEEPKEQHFWLHDSIKQKSEHDAYHSLMQIEFTFS